MKKRPKNTTTDVNTVRKEQKFKSSWGREDSCYSALVDNVDRFGIPIQMINKKYKHQEKENTTKNVLTRVRLLHMNFRKPPSTVQSFENNEMKHLKRLALMQTPYFLIPNCIIDSIKCKKFSNNAKNRKIILFEKPKMSTEDEIVRNSKELDSKSVSSSTHPIKVESMQSAMRTKLTAIIKSNFKQQLRRNTSKVNMKFPLFNLHSNDNKIIICIGIESSNFPRYDTKYDMVGDFYN